MQTLTAITAQKKNRRRYCLFLDGCYAFSVSERIAATLHTGGIFTSERLDAIKSEDEKQRASEKTLSRLSYRPRSRMETLAYLESKEIINLVDYAKKNKLSHSNLINKAKRQTIEAFIEKGIWKIGI